MSQNVAKSQPTVVVRTSREMAWVFGGIVGAVFLFTLTVNVIKLWDPLYDSGLWALSGATGSVFLIVIFMLRSTKLILTDELIHYRSSFFVKRVPLKNIVKADIEIGSKPWTYEPLTRLVVMVRDGEERKRVVLNLGYFHLRECDKFLDALKEQLTKHA